MKLALLIFSLHHGNLIRRGMRSCGSQTTAVVNEAVHHARRTTGLIDWLETIVLLMLETRSAVDCSHGRIQHELRLLTYFPSLYFSGGGERVRSWFVNVCRMCSCGSGRSAREYVRFKWNHTVFSQGYWRSICPSCNGRCPGSSRTWMCGTFHPRHRLSAQITTHSVLCHCFDMR